MIIGITGHARHGKDSIAKLLVEEHGFVRIGFADAVREYALKIDPTISMAGSLAGYPFDNIGANQVLVQGGFWQLSAAVDELGWEKAKTIPDVRRILQSIGEGARQQFGKDFWIDLVVNKYNLYGTFKNYVIADVRYDNEARMIRDAGEYMVRVVRPSFENGVDSRHPSEAQVASMEVDYEIVNAGTLDDLRPRVDNMVEKLNPSIARTSVP